jgi:hypothetical protein
MRGCYSVVRDIVREVGPIIVPGPDARGNVELLA